MTHSRDDLVQYRLDRAFETLAEAKTMASANHWNACLNRLYYCCFYAVSALLLKNDLSSSKHSGVHSLFNRHFVKTDKVPKTLARAYRDFFELRREGDYVDLVQFTESDVAPMIPLAEDFLKHVAGLI